MIDEQSLKDPVVVHVNMLRGTIAKLTPEQIGHLYRGDDAVAVCNEVKRQNPDTFPLEDEIQRLRKALSYIATYSSDLTTAVPIARKTLEESK